MALGEPAQRADGTGSCFVTNSAMEESIKTACVRKALHGFSGSLERWEKRRERGATDEEMMAAIGREIGERGGFCHIGLPVVNYWGGPNPRVEIGFVDEAYTVRGRELLQIAREITGVEPPRPPEAQLSLF